MTKQFINYKRINIKISKLIVFVCLILMLFICINLSHNLFKIHIYNNQEFINYLLSSTHLKANNVSINLFNNIKNPINFLKQELFYDNHFYLSEIKNYEFKNIDNPLVYIYNSKQDILKEVVDNANTSILMASYILSNKLNSKSIQNIVENHDLKELTQINNKDVYEVSRMYIEEIINKYSSLKLLIDLQIGNNDTVKIKNKTCAKIEFVVNRNYESNLELANKLNNMILKKYPSLTDGVSKVDDVLNQDLNDKIILIKVGNVNIKFLDIYNTMTILLDIIKEYIGEENAR